MATETTDGIVGAVLAGGKSTRMGGDKSALVVAGASLRDRALGVLDTVFDRVVVSLAHDDEGIPGRTVVADRFPGLGPLAGLEAVLHAAGGKAAFVLACDLPHVDEEVVRHIVARAEVGEEEGTGRAWIASCEGRLQPLCGVYAAACRPVVRRHLESGDLAMHRLLDALELVEVSVDHLGAFRLFNVNSPADLEQARTALTDG